MLAWATAKVTVCDAAISRPDLPWGPAAPAAKVRVSVEVGMKGAPAAKVNVDGPTWSQLPLTGGSKGGRFDDPETGAEKWTVTAWSEGTPVAPLAGVVERIVRGAAVVVDEDAAGRPDEVGRPACRPAANAPIAPATTATTATPTIIAAR